MVAHGHEQGGRLGPHAAGAAIAGVLVLAFLLPAGAQEVVAAAGGPAVTPTQIAPILDINKMAPGQYAGAVSAAMEGMRLVYGEMSKAEQDKFEAQWAPMFDFPCEEAIAYLNKLNPLLGQFLAIRAAMMDAAIDFDAATKEANTAILMRDAPAGQEALAIAAQRRDLLQSLSRQMEQVTAAILALGPPPDVTQCAQKRRKHHRDATAALFGSSDSLEGEWVGEWEQVKTTDKKAGLDSMVDGLGDALAKAIAEKLAKEGKKPATQPVKTKFGFHFLFTQVGEDGDKEVFHFYNFDDHGTVPYHEKKVAAEPRLSNWAKTCEHWFEYNRNFILPAMEKEDDGPYRLSWHSRCPDDYNRRWVWEFEVKGDEMTLTERGWYAERAYDPLGGGKIGGNAFSHRVVKAKRVARQGGLGMPPGFSVEKAAQPMRVPPAAWVLANVEVNRDGPINADPQKGQAESTFKMYDKVASFRYTWAVPPKKIKPGDSLPYALSVTALPAQPPLDAPGSITQNFTMGMLEDYKDCQFTAGIRQREVLSDKYLPASRKGQYVVPLTACRDDIKAKITVVCNSYGITLGVTYVYAPVPLEAIDDIKLMTPPPDAATRPAPTTRQAEMQAKLERIAFHQENIKIIQYNLQRDQEELARTTDITRRGELYSRVLNNQHNIYSEQDRIKEIETGQIVHTRTPIDELYKARWEESIVQKAAEMRQSSRISDGLQRMAGLAPSDQVEGLRQFIARHADSKTVAAGDVQKLRKVAQIVFDKVQGHWEGEAATNLDKALQADDYLARAEKTKFWAEVGLTAYTLGYGVRGPMLVFQAGTGFVEAEGGVGNRAYEAAKRSLAWVNTATFVASEAMTGYEKGGWFGDNKGSVWGAVERAGEAFLMVKGFEWAAGKVFGVPANQPRPTVQEQFDLARQKQAIEDGVSLVDDYQRTYQEYQRVLEFGGSAAEIAQMERMLQQKAASVHSTMEAKMFLKGVGRDPRYTQLLADYSQRLDQVHQAAQAEWRAAMKAKGYEHVDDWLLNPIRNSASAGSVGMDYDIALTDRIPWGQTGQQRYITFVKDGVRVTPNQVVKDAGPLWDKAYFKTTGYSARRSWDTLTLTSSPEAYRDLSWLGTEKIKQVRIDTLLAGYAPQAGDVTAYKAHELYKQLGLTRMQATMETARGTAKDIGTKLVPLLEESARRAATTGGNTANALRIDGYRKHWKEISEVLQSAWDDPIGADRKLRQLTGGKGVPEVVADVRDMIATYGKNLGK